MVNKSDLMDQNTKARNLKVNTPYAQYQDTEEWVIIEYLLKELETNQDIELKTAPEYVIGYLVEKLRNRDLLKSKEKEVIIGKRISNGTSLRLSVRSR
jgi:hypothetical protein